MKKYIVMVIMLGFAAVSGLTYSVHKIIGQKDEVKIQYEVLEGNPEAAEGITFHVRNQWDGKLHWDSQVVLGKGGEVESVVTEFEDRFKEPTEENLIIHQIDEVTMNLANNSTYSLDGIEYISAKGYEFDRCKNLLDNLSQETKAGEKKTQTIQLNEFQKYYDIWINLNLKSGSYFVVGEEENILRNLLQIKIPDSHLVNIVIQKDDQGEIVRKGSDDVYGLVSFDISAIQTKDGVYFVFYGVDSEGQPMELEIEHGNGIFYIPIEHIEDQADSVYEAESVVFYNRMQKAFALSEKECYPLEIITDEAEETLYLLTEEQGKVVWRCIDLATREEQQRLELNEYHSTGNVYQVCHQMDIVEDGLVIISGDNGFAYLEEKNGIFEKKIIANLGDGPGVGDDGYCYDLMYRDGKAALVIAEGLETSTEVYVYVLGEKGVEYKAHFMPSFAYESYHGGMNWIHLRKEAPLEIIMK
jgi:hypothetical protein